MASQVRRAAEQGWIRPQRRHWKLASRIGFRFCFLYLGSYCLTTHVVRGLFPSFDLPDLATVAPIRQAVFWSAAHIFHLSTSLVYTGSRSGDKTFDWVLVFCLLTIGFFGTALWSVLDRRRETYITLHKWFHLFLRFAVGSQLLFYGMVKLVPLQISFPSLTRLVEPLGNFSPMGVLWSSIGAAPRYEMFVGAAEMLGGILLFFPRTTTFGALVCLAEATNVFMLNMTYDVPVKLFSFHLILMSLALLAPELPRIARFFFSDRGVRPSNHPKLFRTASANRVALSIQIVFGLMLIATDAYIAWTSWQNLGGGAPKSPLYGIWNVDQPLTGGAQRPSLPTDRDGWRRVIFEDPRRMTVQRTDDTFVDYGASIDPAACTLALTKESDKDWKAKLKFQRSGQDGLTLVGEMDGQRLQIQLQLLDINKLPLINRGFRWIQDYPLNR